MHFMLQICKKPQRHTIYWVVKDIKRTGWVLGRPVAYRHVTQETNCMVDNMAHRVLAAKGKVTYMQGDVPTDAPSN